MRQATGRRPAGMRQAFRGSLSRLRPPLNARALAVEWVILPNEKEKGGRHYVIRWQGERRQKKGLWQCLPARLLSQVEIRAATARGSYGATRSPETAPLKERIRSGSTSREHWPPIASPIGRSPATTLRPLGLSGGTGLAPCFPPAPRRRPFTMSHRQRFPSRI